MHARVFVIHDVRAIRAMLSQALESRGCTAIGIEGFRAATGLAIVDPPDVIVTDERLVDEDPEGFRALREEFPKVVVVALSAPMRQRAYTDRQGIDCAVEKPARDEQVVQAVRWAMELTACGLGDAPS
jgi:DNA-binding NtrC family response regulator